MPNWVKNKLTIDGENAEAVMNELITTDSDGGKTFDFNKIIPMPDSLQIIAGSTTDKCVALYLTAANPNVEYYGSAGDKLAHGEYGEVVAKLRVHDRKINGLDLMLPVEKIAEYEKDVIGDDPECYAGSTREEAIAYGKRAANNVLSYGHMNWYDWSVDRWGTKWNACDCRFNGSTVEFDTAWADVGCLMRQLSEKYPDNTFCYDFAEEQPGFHAGEFTYQDGDVIGGEYLDEYGKAAYEKYFEFWGGAEDYRYNRRTRTYEYIDGDSESESGSEM